MTKVQRYKVGFFQDEWGLSGIAPRLIPDDNGCAVKFEDYCKLETELAAKDEVIAEAGEMLAMRDRQLAALKAENETAWAQAHRLALELECLLLDTKDNAIVSKWWDSGMEALDEYQQLKPGAKEEAEAWAKMRKEML